MQLRPSGFDCDLSFPIDALCGGDEHREARSMPVNTYSTLNDPLATGSRGIAAQGINASSQIVGYYDDGSTFAQGFLYSGDLPRNRDRR